MLTKGISTNEPRKHNKESFVVHVSHSIPETSLFFVFGGQRKQGPKLVVFRAAPGIHGTDVYTPISDKLSSIRAEQYPGGLVERRRAAPASNTKPKCNFQETMVRILCGGDTEFNEGMGC
jgi:hypothetical protein